VITYAIERYHCSRIVVGDGRDGIIFFSYDEVSVDGDFSIVFLFIELKFKGKQDWRDIMY